MTASSSTLNLPSSSSRRWRTPPLFVAVSRASIPAPPGCPRCAGARARGPWRWAQPQSSRPCPRSALAPARGRRVRVGRGRAPAEVIFSPRVGGCKYRPGSFPKSCPVRRRLPIPLASHPEQRDAALARMREETFDVVVIGGGATGRGLRAGRRHARAVGRAGRGARLRLRHLEPLEQAHPRRAALPRAAGLRARARGAARARRCCSTCSRRTSCGRCRSCYPLHRRIWQRAYVGAGLLLYDALGGHKGLPRHRHLTKRAARCGSPRR